MKHHIVSTLLLGLLLATATTVGAQTSAEEALFDSAAVITYSDGRLALTGGEGNLFLYSENDKGFRAVYLLFTPRPYIHIDASASTATPDEYITIPDQHGEWINLATHTGAHGNPAFPIADPASTYRCIKKHGNTVQVLLSVDRNKQRTERTVLLNVLPKLEPTELECYIAHDGTNISLDDFRHTKLDPASDHPLAGYTLVVKWSNSILLDSIRYADSLSLIHNTTSIGGDALSIPLDNIKPGKHAKAVDLAIHYRMFDKSGSIKRSNHTDSFRLSWTGNGGSWWLKAVTIVVILLLAAFIAWTALPCVVQHMPKSIANRILNKSTNQ